MLIRPSLVSTLFKVFLFHKIDQSAQLIHLSKLDLSSNLSIGDISNSDTVIIFFNYITGLSVEKYPDIKMPMPKLSMATKDQILEVSTGNENPVEKSDVVAGKPFFDNNVESNV